MGLEIVVPDVAAPLESLAAAGIPAVVMMVDGALVMPGAPLPPGWRDVRLRLPEGTVSLVRRGHDVAVVVFGNADPALREAQSRVAAALGVC